MSARRQPSGQLPSEEAHEQLWGTSDVAALTSRACGRHPRDPALPAWERAAGLPVHRRPRTTPCSARSCSSVHGRTGISHGGNPAPCCTQTQGSKRRLGSRVPRPSLSKHFLHILVYAVEPPPGTPAGNGCAQLDVVKPCVRVARALPGRGGRLGQQQKHRHRPRVQEERAHRRVVARTAVSSEPALPHRAPCRRPSSLPFPWLEVEQ